MRVYMCACVRACPRAFARAVQEGLSARGAGLPEVDAIFEFLRKTFEVAKWSPECHIIALVYVNRLTGFTNIRLHLHNWRPILLCALLLAQKLWDDKSLANVDFPYIWSKAMPTKDRTRITLSVINFMERKFLELLQYSVHVKASLYAKYYFELRTLREGDVFPLAPLKTTQVRARALPPRPCGALLPCDPPCACLSARGAAVHRRCSLRHGQGRRRRRC